MDAPMKGPKSFSGRSLSRRKVGRRNELGESMKTKPSSEHRPLRSRNEPIPAGARASRRPRLQEP